MKYIAADIAYLAGGFVLMLMLAPAVILICAAAFVAAAVRRVL